MAEYSIRSRQVPIKRKSSSSSSGSSGSGSGSDSGSGSSSSGDSNPNSNPNSKPLLSRKPPQYPAQSNTSFSLLDIVRLLGGLFLLSSTLSYFVTSNSIFWNYGPSFAAQSGRLTAWLRGPLQLTPAQLALYNGTDPKLPIYLGLNGSIYDVSASPHMYGPGGSYGFFAGKDATRAFVTGCFKEDLVGDLRGVEEMFIPVDDDDEWEDSREGKRERKLRREREVREAKKEVFDAVEDWRKMFDGGKGGKYFWVGTIVGQEWGEKRKLCKQAEEKRPKRKTRK